MKNLLNIFPIVIILALSFAGILTPTPAYILNAASASQSSPNTVAQILISGETSAPSNVTYTVSLFRYSEQGSATLVSSYLVKEGQLVTLFDKGLSAFRHSQPYVHYSILVLENFVNGSIAQVINYHWSAPVKGDQNGIGGSLGAANEIVLNRLNNDTSTQVQVDGKAVTYQIAPGVNGNDALSKDTWPTIMLHTVEANKNTTDGLVASSSISPNDGGLGYNEWFTVGTWYRVPTIVGEGSSYGDINDTFTYGVSSCSTLDALISFGGAWSISGSVTNCAGATQGWPTLTLGDGNHYAKTYFDYEEQELYHCNAVDNCQPLNEYQMFVTSWRAGYVDWNTAGKSSSAPGSGLSASAIQQGGYSCAVEGPGGTLTIYASNGFRYSIAASICSGIKGTTYCATFGDSTDYNQHTTQYFVFGTSKQHPYYYAYTNGYYSNPGNWPVVFTSYGTSPTC